MFLGFIYLGRCQFYCWSKVVLVKRHVSRVRR